VRRLDAAGLRVVLMTPHPVVDDFDEQRRAVFFGRQTQIFGDFAGARQSRDDLLSALARAGAGFAEVNGLALYCQDERCPVIDGAGRYLLFDGAHISTYLSGRVAEQVYERLGVSSDFFRISAQ
jgi:hypothetical protein